MPDFLNHPHKTCDPELCWPVTLLSNGEKRGMKGKWLDRAAAKPTALRQIFIDEGMKDNRFKSKFFEGVQVNPQSFVGVVMYKSREVA